MGIHEDARKGTLVGSTLTGYIEGNPNIVNEWDPVEGMTPLAAAVIEGHAEVVKQLLRRRAKPDAPCKNGEMPLLLAAWKTSSNRSKIIQLLLNIKKMPQGYVDATCKIANGNTPLMFILSNTNPIDLDSVRLLRKAGASLTLENNDGVVNGSKETNAADFAANVDNFVQENPILERFFKADEGVAICFINQDVNDATNLTLDQIVKMLEPMKEKRGGDTETGTTLRKKILEPMVYKKLSEKNFERPLLISILTDGQPSGEKKTEFVDAVLECGQRLEEAGYPRQSVKFLVAQIGTAKSATKFLESLRSNEQLKDVMFCTTDQLDAKLSDLHKNERDLDRWLLETLFSTIKDAE
ncbi:hypothetical protein TrVFT333_010506 [Trichoderma virens FT-333]|nr:hypothetical protein TrVFT333_010506 [Trichoderma virens FT-333]